MPYAIRSQDDGTWYSKSSGWVEKRDVATTWKTTGPITQLLKYNRHRFKPDARVEVVRFEMVEVETVRTLHRNGDYFQIVPNARGKFRRAD